MSSATKRVLGIEGGGTKTEWIYVQLSGDGQEVIDRGVLPAANLKIISDDALLTLFRVLPAEATHIGAFLAGCGLDADRSCGGHEEIALDPLAARVACGIDNGSARRVQRLTDAGARTEHHAPGCDTDHYYLPLRRDPGCTDRQILQWRPLLDLRV